MEAVLPVVPLEVVAMEGIMGLAEVVFLVDPGGDPRRSSRRWLVGTAEGKAVGRFGVCLEELVVDRQEDLPVALVDLAAAELKWDIKQPHEPAGGGQVGGFFHLTS